MVNFIPGNIYRAKDLPNFKRLYSSLQVFPTPFKGIYYVPYETEIKGKYISDPNLVVYSAVGLYLKSSKYYCGLNTALYYLRIVWNLFGFDIINKKISRRIIRKLPSQKYWRGKVIAKLMKSYPYPIRLHRMKKISLSGLLAKGSISYSSMEKTMADARYLSSKGDKDAKETLKIIENYNKGSKTKRKY